MDAYNLLPEMCRSGEVVSHRFISGRAPRELSEILGLGSEIIKSGIQGNNWEQDYHGFDKERFDSIIGGGSSSHTEECAQSENRVVHKVVRVGA